MPRHKKLAGRRGKEETAFIDRLVYLAAIATPVMTLPQLYVIWIKDEKGASVITWAAYVVIAFIWLLYALKHKDKPLILLEASAVVLYSLIVIGLLVNNTR